MKSPACFLFAWPITSLLLLSSLWSCNEIHTQKQSWGAQEGSRKTSTYNLARLLFLCYLLGFVQSELSPSRHMQQPHQPPNLPPCWTQQPQLSISFPTTLLSVDELPCSHLPPRFLSIATQRQHRVTVHKRSRSALMRNVVRTPKWISRNSTRNASNEIARVMVSFVSALLHIHTVAYFWHGLLWGNDFQKLA